MRILRLCRPNESCCTLYSTCALRTTRLFGATLSSCATGRLRVSGYSAIQVLNGCLEWGGADLAEQFIVTTHGKRRCDGWHRAATAFVASGRPALQHAGAALQPACGAQAGRSTSSTTRRCRADRGFTASSACVRRPCAALRCGMRADGLPALRTGRAGGPPGRWAGAVPLCTRHPAALV